MQSFQALIDSAVIYLKDNGINLVYAIIILILGKWLARFLTKISMRAILKAKVNATLASFFKNVIYYVLLTFVVLAALNEIGVQTTSFLAILGAAGLAIGLALQGSLANFSAGVMLILFQPFKVGEDVEAGGARGTVKEIQIFSTIMDGGDNIKIIVPNSKITSDKIIIRGEKISNSTP